MNSDNIRTSRPQRFVNKIFCALGQCPFTIKRVQVFHHVHIARKVIAQISCLRALSIFINSNMGLKYGCIVPRQWEICSHSILEIILYNELNWEWRKSQRLDTAVITIVGVTATPKALDPFLWLCIVGDTNFVPNEQYTFLYIECFY